MIHFCACVYARLFIFGRARVGSPIKMIQKKRKSKPLLPRTARNAAFFYCERREMQILIGGDRSKLPAFLFIHSV